jgi:hypothetical protein
MKKSKRSRKARTPHSRRKTGVKVDLVEAGKETRFKPGTSGNPAGRPRTKFFRDIARELVEMVDTKSKKARARRLVETLFREAEKGSLGHFKQVLNLLEEDSSTPQSRVQLTAEAVAPAAKRSLQDTLAAIRHVYGLSDPDDMSGADVLKAAEAARERVRAKLLPELYPQNA